MTNIVRMPFLENAYDIHDIWIDERCKEEIIDIIERSGNIRKFRNAWEARINYLAEHRENAILHRAWFEELKYEKPFYSMHIANINNMRILYAFKGHSIHLLCAFSEKSSTKQDSYHKHISVAKNRLAEILKEGSF